MALWVLYLLLFSTVGSAASASSSSSSSLFLNSEPPKTIYEALQINGLPKGLLPSGIRNFTVDNLGNFQVFLEKPCYAKFENQVYYEPNIKGNLSFGRIGELSGMNTKELFLWFPVKNICVDVPSRGLIYFDVGVAKKQFSLSSFENPPECKDNVSKVKPQIVNGKALSDHVEKFLSGKLYHEQ